MSYPERLLQERVPTYVVGLNIAVILLLVLLNGVLSMTELAIVSARHGRLQQMAENGNKGAATAARLASDPSRFLSTVQIGITLIGIANGAFGGATLTEPVANLLRRIPAVESSANSIAGLLVVVIITYLSLVIGELVPKRLALQHPETIASTMAPIMSTLSSLFKPIVWFLGVSNDAVLAILRVRESDEPAVTEDEIRLMLMQATDAGVFERAEQEMVAGVFGLGDRTAGELMTPRHAISWLDIAEPDSVNIKIITEGAFSSYPVIDDEPDNVVGVVSTRDFLRQSLTGEQLSIRAAMKPALFVPEILPVLQVLRSMRDAKTNLAIVIDEYGGFEGLITDNDVIRGLVDEIGSGEANGTEEIEGATLQEDGSWLLDGQFAAHEFRELFDIKALDGEEAGRFETIAGYILDRLGHIPTVGESVELENLRIDVVAMDGYRIDTVRVTPLEPALSEETD